MLVWADLVEPSVAAPVSNSRSSLRYAVHVALPTMLHIQQQAFLFPCPAPPLPSLEPVASGRDDDQQPLASAPDLHATRVLPFQTSLSPDPSPNALLACLLAVAAA